MCTVYLLSYSVFFIVNFSTYFDITLMKIDFEFLTLLSPLFSYLLLISVFLLFVVFVSESKKLETPLLFIDLYLVILYINNLQLENIPEI